MVLSGEVLAPDGTPPAPEALGSRAIGSLDEALDVVRSALSNPGSVLSHNGFRADTPVYIWRLGKQASKAISSQEPE